MGLTVVLQHTFLIRGYAGLAVVTEITGQYQKFYLTAHYVIESGPQGKIVFIKKPGGLQLSCHSADGCGFAVCARSL